MAEPDPLQMRDDLLQAAYWLREEGIEASPTAEQLARFVAMEPDALIPHLERIVADGLLSSSDGRYSLTERGREVGGTAFGAEFAQLTRPSHGECDENCWCHDSAEAAERCHEERHSHGTA